MVWQRNADVPVTRSTCATLCGQLLAVGGVDSDEKDTTAVYQYNPNADKWKVISHMAELLKMCLEAILPGGDNQGWI